MNEHDQRLRAVFQAPSEPLATTRLSVNEAIGFSVPRVNMSLGRNCVCSAGVAPNKQSTRNYGYETHYCRGCDGRRGGCGIAGLCPNEPALRERSSCSVDFDTAGKHADSGAYAASILQCAGFAKHVRNDDGSARHCKFACRARAHRSCGTKPEQIANR